MQQGARTCSRLVVGVLMFLITWPPILFAHGAWSIEEVDYDISSSTYLELLAVHRALEAFSPLITLGSNIQVSTDNQNVY